MRLRTPLLFVTVLIIATSGLVYEEDWLGETSFPPTPEQNDITAPPLFLEGQENGSFPAAAFRIQADDGAGAPVETRIELALPDELSTVESKDSPVTEVSKTFKTCYKVPKKDELSLIGLEVTKDDVSIKFNHTKTSKDNYLARWPR